MTATIGVISINETDYSVICEVLTGHFYMITKSSKYFYQTKKFKIFTFIQTHFPCFILPSQTHQIQTAAPLSPSGPVSARSSAPVCFLCTLGPERSTSHVPSARLSACPASGRSRRRLMNFLLAVQDSNIFIASIVYKKKHNRVISKSKSQKGVAQQCGGGVGSAGDML